MYDSRKTKRKKGGGENLKVLGSFASRVGTRMANRVSSAKQALTKTVKKAASNLKSDRLTALMKGTNTQTFCCANSSDSHNATNLLGNKKIGLNMFGKNNGTDCKPVWTGQCNVRGLYTHKYRCFDAKYYPMPSDMPEKFPVLSEKAPVFGDTLFQKLKKGIDGDLYNKPSEETAKKLTTQLQTQYEALTSEYAVIKEYFETYKDVLRVPSLEQFKNSKKSANPEWYSLIATKAGRRKKIKDVNKKVIAKMLKELTAYANDISLKQIGLRCQPKSIELYGRFGEKPKTEKEQKEDKMKESVINKIDDKFELITEEDKKFVKIFKQPKDNTDDSKRVLIYTYFKVEPEITNIQDGLITRYVRNLKSFIDTLHVFINGSSKYNKYSADNGIRGVPSRYSSYILMGNYMNYENALNDHLLEIAPMLDNIIEYQGYRDNYMRRMVRYIALVKSYVDNSKNQSNTISDALYYGLYNNIYERNYNDSNPYQKTCQHISKIGTKAVKVSSEVTRATIQFLGISALVGVTAVGTALLLLALPALIPLSLNKITNFSEDMYGYDTRSSDSFSLGILETLNTMKLFGMFSIGFPELPYDGGKNRTKRRRKISLRKYK